PRFSVQFFKTQAKHCLFAPFSACSNVGATCSNPAEGVCVVNNVASTGYSSWSGTQIGTIVAGETVKHCSIHAGVLCSDAGVPCSNPADGTCMADKSGWPATGPVFVVANNRLSSNAIPFTVQNCVDSGIACPTGESCCSNGSCQKSCQPVARNSGYAWRFSTNVLPVLPQVVERAVCDATSTPTVPQSPSPYKGSSDACKNAMVFIEFNRILDSTTFDSNSVKVEECGEGAQPACTATVPLKPFSAPGTFGSCDSLLPTECKTFATRPADSYNGGTHYFKKNTWYRVTLVSNPGTSTGLKEAGPDGRYLDGDLDRRQGGDYVYTFRVRNSDDPCQLSSVYVDAPAATIQQDQDAMDFNAGLWGGNCNRLQCGPTEPYSIAWSKVGPYLSLLTPPPAAAGCAQPVRGVQETSPGAPTPLTADVTPTPLGTAPSKQGHSDVTVKFADPRVVDVTPKAECVQACINADIVATFNVPMDPTTMTGSTVELKRCRNASCTAPFAPDLGGGITATITALPDDGLAPDGVTILHKHVTIQLSGDLQPGTFYLAKIKGGAAGVKSRSGVLLSGLNDGNYYSWKFRTKDDPTACSVARTEVKPGRALLRYVGDRAAFGVTPYGSPDECSSVGQQLRATSYNWLWDLGAPGTNMVVRGFYSGGTLLPIRSHAAPGDLVDTVPLPKAGCTSQCLLAGSQDAEPQCGNGVVDGAYEECELAHCSVNTGVLCTNIGSACANPPDGSCVRDTSCSDNCLRTGAAAPACGNHVVESAAGETCDMIPDPAVPGSFVWPNGCKQPDTHVEGFPDNLGCVFTGSSTAAGSVCGDGFVSDGEACDDGNRGNGDGCSANCLHEGTKQSCNTAPIGSCVNFCGNGLVEAGEDAACEPSPVVAGCDRHTCLKLGTPRCSAGSNCCGNGVDDLAAGEDPGCDTDPERSEFCTDSCKYKGSSPFYTSPSFCGDGIAGKGEKAACETVTLPAPAVIDPFQALSAEPQSGFDSTTAAGSTTTVKATVTGVADADAGRAQVALACNCKNEPLGTQDAYCQNINPPTTNNLACADNGCCTPRPTVVSVMPTDMNSCRNAEIDVVFSEMMNQTTISSNLLVGYNNGSAPCPAGSVALSYDDGMLRRQGFWRSVWNAVLAFVREYVLRPAFGVSGPPPVETYCSVEGRITTIPDGPPGVQHSKTIFAVKRAMPANKFMRVQLNSGVKSVNGVPLSDAGGLAGYRAYFGTGPTICAIAKTEVTPPSVLLTSVRDVQTVVARGLAASGQAIVPTIDYNWDWSWTLPTNDWEIVLNPRVSNVTQCTLGATCTAGGGCACTINATTCTVPNGQSTCDVSSTAITSIADVRVRGSLDTDQPTGVKPRSSSGPRPLEAKAWLTHPDGSPYSISSLTPPNPSGSATVLLCKREHVWPHDQRCVSGTIHIPWIVGSSVSCTADTWYPFYDAGTNTEFYYCRDQGETAGDVSTTALPCLKEQPAQVLNPGPDILNEYLFTFETNALNLAARCIDSPAPAGSKWADDAVGIRISKNPMHLSAADWYAAKGFTGSPKAVTVNGYDAVQDERTVYVNAAAKGIPAGKLFTNVNTLSYSDGAEPETASIFNQILSYVSFNSGPVNADLLDMGVCRGTTDGMPLPLVLRDVRVVSCNKDEDCRVDSNGLPVAGRQTYTCDLPSGICKNGGSFAYYAGVSIACNADVDCQVDGHGNPIPSRIDKFKCDDPKTKIVRDVKRWSDLQKLRAALIAKRDATGKFPTLDAGTFLRAQTNTLWPSWSDALGKPLGLTLPVDPLNRYGACSETNYDSKTCWNDKDRLYKCPVDSHVYEYRSVGGTDFQIRNDFEYKNVNGGTDSWSGGTCPELDSVACDPLTTQCAKTCSQSSVNRGASCTQDSDCSGGACTGPCNYKDGKIFIGGGSAPFPGPFCVGTPVGTGGVCGDGILAPTEQCEIGQTTSGPCDADMKLADTRAGSHGFACTDVCTWIPQGKCSANSGNAGATCTIDSQCHGGTGTPKCVNWAGLTPTTQDFRCVGGNNSTNCHADSDCAGGVCVGACSGGTCGDGVRQNPPETCDDGPLNGTYGHCNSTCTASAQNCGDGKKQPNEACDCKEKNGQYYFNGTLSTGAEPGISGPACGVGNPVAVPSCSWDCQAAGPRCGDGVVNGGETCDGGFQEFKGYCNDNDDPAKTTGCDNTGQCPDLGTCSSGHCTNAPGKTCATNEQCVKLCGSFCPTPEQKRRRECTPNDKTSVGDDTAACTWGTWLCTSPGSCGNGKKETGEECDDGNVDNTDSCVIDPGNHYVCKTAHCGDGYVNPSSGEECDEGVNNGRPCLPEYGQTCNYCSGACRVNTVSGGFCGDGLIEDNSWTPPPSSDKTEQCDGANGLGVDWICVSKAKQDKSYGKYMGQAVCSDASCRRACPDPDSEPCLNAVGTNTDNDTCPTPTPDGCHGPLAYNVTDLVPGEHRTCVTGFDGKRRCTQLATAFFFEPSLLLNPSFMLGLTSGGGYSAGNYALIVGLGQHLYDVCDPDDDNDGVPDDRDCNPKDPYIHPAYLSSWTDRTGITHTINIPEAPEYCDGIDNNCDNMIDNDWIIDPKPTQQSIHLTGTLIDAFFPQVNVQGATVAITRMVCANDKTTACTSDGNCPGSTCGAFGRTYVTGADGRYDLGIVRRPASLPGLPQCTMRVQVDPYKPASDLDIPFLAGSPDELEERRDRGYFANGLEIPNVASHDQTIYLIPIPRSWRFMYAFVWDGGLGSNYTDIYMHVPGDAGGGPPATPIAPNPLSYHNQFSTPGHNIAANPWGRLMCHSASGSGNPTSCNNFDVAPQIMFAAFNGPQNVTAGQAYKIWVDDYACPGSHPCNGNWFRSINARMYVAWCNAGTDCDKYNDPINVPASGGKKYWHPIDTHYDGAQWGDDIPGIDGDGVNDGWSDTPPGSCVGGPTPGKTCASNPDCGGGGVCTVP
ncbi:MAG: hypothetical protein RL272_87, partial [Candidatus Parcubacteria bacterium]